MDDSNPSSSAVRLRLKTKAEFDDFFKYELVDHTKARYYNQYKERSNERSVQKNKFLNEQAVQGLLG